MDLVLLCKSAKPLFKATLKKQLTEMVELHHEIAERKPANTTPFSELLSFALDGYLFRLIQNSELRIGSETCWIKNLLHLSSLLA